MNLGSRRFKKVREGPRRFEKVQEGSRRLKKILVVGGEGGRGPGRGDTLRRPLHPGASLGVRHQQARPSTFLGLSGVRGELRGGKVEKSKGVSRSAQTPKFLSNVLLSRTWGVVLELALVQVIGTTDLEFSTFSHSRLFNLNVPTNILLGTLQPTPGPAGRFPEGRSSERHSSRFVGHQVLGFCY